jgi:hypothetical protein
MSWWTKLFGEPREADEWRMCKQLESTYINTTYNGRGEANERKVNINYYLYENQFGERKFDIADSLRGDYTVTSITKDDIAFRLRIYRQTVKPWLDGRTDPEVPAYEQVPVNDFQRRLTKKK